MTDDGMTLIELVEKTADADPAPDMPAFAADRMMDAEVETLTGAAKGARTPLRETQRNGYRERDWDTRAGRIALEIPKLRKGGDFPSFLEPRRTAEKALVAVIRGRPTSTACPPARSTIWSRPWARAACPRARCRGCAPTSTCG
jgi:hypothetical protein